jgi:hypothetical protein
MPNVTPNRPRTNNVNVSKHLIPLQFQKLKAAITFYYRHPHKTALLLRMMPDGRRIGVPMKRSAALRAFSQALPFCLLLELRFASFQLQTTSIFIYQRVV